MRYIVTKSSNASFSVEGVESASAAIELVKGGKGDSTASTENYSARVQPERPATPQQPGNSVRVK